MANSQDDIVSQSILQQDKENYIANSLMRVLLNNNVNQSKCYRIIELLKEKVLGSSGHEEKTI